MVDRLVSGFKKWSGVLHKGVQAPQPLISEEVLLILHVEWLWILLVKKFLVFHIVFSY